MLCIDSPVSFAVMFCSLPDRLAQFAINTPSSRLEALPDGAGAICLADASLLTDCVYTCVCVCVRERERERERASVRQTVSKCLYMLFFLYLLEYACAGIYACFGEHLKECICVLVLLLSFCIHMCVYLFGTF